MVEVTGSAVYLDYRTFNGDIQLGSDILGRVATLKNGGFKTRTETENFGCIHSLSLFPLWGITNKGKAQIGQSLISSS